MPNLELDDQHIYRLDGRRLISVTQALSVLDDRWKVDPFYLERGRIIHLCTEYLDWDELDLQTVDDQILPYFNAYVKFQEETKFKVGLVECPLWHPQYFYAGKIDRTGDLNGDHVLIDLKSGAKTRVDELQVVAYWELCRANNIPVKKQFALYLKDSGTYSLVEVEKPKLLLPVFLAALTCARFKEGL
jgi:hypothetical protein